jgi:transcriptional regulator with XRE-family HTH domain
MKTELFHQRLERIRQEKKLTAKAMAELIDVPESTYREWEKGRGMKQPPFKKISQVLAISVTELVIGEKPEWQDVLERITEIEVRMTELRAYLSSRI